MTSHDGSPPQISWWYVVVVPEDLVDHLVAWAARTTPPALINQPTLYAVRSAITATAELLVVFTLLYITINFTSVYLELLSKKVLLLCTQLFVP